MLIAFSKACGVRRLPLDPLWRPLGDEVSIDTDLTRHNVKSLRRLMKQPFFSKRKPPVICSIWQSSASMNCTA
jgi:hypothetical protein